MKKFIIVILAVVILVGGLGGYAYAQIDHQPMKGQKLIGTTEQGTFVTWTTHLYWGAFKLINPDCVGEITIERIALIRGDGTVIYEGPLLELVRDETTGEVVQEIPITEPMKPHSVHVIVLNIFMKDPDAPDPDRWLTVPEANELPLASYTLEVTWTADKKCLSPLGQITNGVMITHPDGTRETVLTCIPMVEVKQRLKH